MKNELKYELSPYLLQHQNNPVHWLPWNEKTLELARKEGKPIFLSSGYSTCHWCHVMERESFENQQIADIMNSKFINIKLDREEHPNIDGIYMHVVQAITGGGGWPMSVWMTPDLLPFYAGTYFPPEDRYYGRPGFKALLLTLSEHWEENREKCLESARNIAGVLKKSASIPVVTSLPNESIHKCKGQLSRSYEPSFGGFSEQPKFPQPVNLQFLIHYSKSDKDAFKMVERTLTMMRKGGIYDHIGYGFSRYSTDKKWHVPHFEKMLYDQSQLITAYINAHLISGSQHFADVVHEILEYLNRDMSVEGGGFYSAEDADSLPTSTSTEKKEGAFYVWKKDEIDVILGSTKLSNGKNLCDLFAIKYGVKANGNVDPYQDPHEELKHQNVLYEAKTDSEVAKEFQIKEDEVKHELEIARKKLFDWRNSNRPRPHLDNKFIASWNGLAIGAFALAGFTFNRDEYIQRAIAGVEFIEENFIKDGDLLRSCYSKDGNVTNLETPILACVDDFSNVICGLLNLFQATMNTRFLKLAIELQQKQDELFWDENDGGYFVSRSNDPSVIVRLKDDDDGAEPSSNSTSLINLMRLNSIVPEKYNDKIQKIFFQFSDRLSKIPISLPLMTAAFQSYQNGYGRIVIIGKNVDESRELYTALKRQLIPLSSLVITVDFSKDYSELVNLMPYLTEKINEVQENEIVVIIRKDEKEIRIHKSEEFSVL